MIKKRKLLIIPSVILMVTFLLTKIFVLSGLIGATDITRIIEISCFLLFSPLFYFLMKSQTVELKDGLLKQIKDSEDFIDSEPSFLLPINTVKLHTLIKNLRMFQVGL